MAETVCEKPSRPGASRIWLGSQILSKCNFLFSAESSLPAAGFSEALEMARQYDVRLIPYENEQGIAHTREVLSSIRSGQSVAVLIGPEGGFETEEVQAASAAGFVPVTLGHRILRTETAGLAALSVLMYLLEE